MPRDVRCSSARTHFRLLLNGESHTPVAIPDEPHSLAVALRRTHGRYALYLNARRNRTGHLWQNRFYSCPLDQRHLWIALRYVERNPVRANLVERPEQ